MTVGGRFLQTALALGPRNLFDVACYRLRLKVNPAAFVGKALTQPNRPYFEYPRDNCLPAIAADPRAERTLLFGHREIAIGEAPPEWFVNPFDKTRVFPEPQRPWWRIADFDPRVGDIKAVWELSRFDWALVLAQQARAGNLAALSRLDNWLTDWVVANPPYLGPNWKCAQEASIRIIHLAAADLILGSRPSAAPGLLDFVRIHLRRIAPTTSYARAQDNNHGTSEAAALFIGGHWLAAHGHRDGERYARKGRAMLEERVARLVMPDGAFSQYSTTYHRMMLDTLSFAEAWRRRLALAPFSKSYRDRAGAAVRWLERMTSAENGDAPNIGANDGTHILNLTDRPYRDFRPSVQLGAYLFEGRRAYAEPGLDASLRWLGLEPGEAPVVVAAAASDAGLSGGFAVLSRGGARAVLRVPRFRFRPSQADALHLDLWIGGCNLLRDGGTYSYNADPELSARLAGTGGHSTVQFDDRDQMPRLGRFLFGDWLKPSRYSYLPDRQDVVTAGAGYIDFRGAAHERDLKLGVLDLEVTDRVSGFQSSAVLRWRLPHGEWRLDGGRVTDGVYNVSVEGNVAIARIELSDGWESRLYNEKSRVSVLEIEVREAATLKTTIDWPA